MFIQNVLERLCFNKLCEVCSVYENLIAYDTKERAQDRVGDTMVVREREHRCTLAENPGGGGVLEVFAKIPQEKLPGGVHLFWVIRKFAWGGCCFIPTPPNVSFHITFKSFVV